MQIHSAIHDNTTHYTTHTTHSLTQSLTQPHTQSHTQSINHTTTHHSSPRVNPSTTVCFDKLRSVTRSHDESVRESVFHPVCLTLVHSMYLHAIPRAESSSHWVKQQSAHMTVVVGYSEETMLCVSGTRQVTVTGRCCEWIKWSVEVTGHTGVRMWRVWLGDCGFVCGCSTVFVCSLYL